MAEEKAPEQLDDNPLHIYVAAPWVRKADAIEFGRLLGLKGYVVTSTWFEHPDVSIDSTGINGTDPKLAEQAAQDVADILRSDVLVVLNLEKSEGKAVETGIALIAGMPVISYGPRSNIFQTLPTVTEARTVQDVMNKLAEIQATKR